MPSSKTVGLSLIGVALFVGIMPLQISGLGADPSTRAYRDAKGSRVPDGYTHANAPVFFKIAGAVGALGVLVLTFSASSEYLERRRRRRGVR